MPLISFEGCKGCGKSTQVQRLADRLADRPISKKRLGNRRKIRDRMEEQPKEFYERVRAAYHDLGKSGAERIRLLDGQKSADEIDYEIWNAVGARFPGLLDQPSTINHQPT